MVCRSLLVGFSLMTALLLGPSGALAKEQSRRTPLVDVMTEYLPDYRGHLYIHSRESTGEATHFSFIDSDRFGFHLSVAELRNPKGIFQILGRNVVFASTAAFDPVRGGDIEIIYPKNVFSGDYRVFRVVCVRDARTGNWVARADRSDGERFSRVMLDVSTRLAIPNGVERIRFMQAGRVVRSYESAELPQVSRPTRSGSSPPSTPRWFE